MQTPSRSSRLCLPRSIFTQPAQFTQLNPHFPLFNRGETSIFFYLTGVKPICCLCLTGASQKTSGANLTVAVPNFLAPADGTGVQTQLNRPLRSRRKARKERHCDRRVTALTIGLHHLKE